jgi:Flp pilus assembly protein TadG
LKEDFKMTSQRFWVGTLRRDKGSQVAEAALVMPLAFMILLGIYWFGRAFNTYSTINQAAREGARVAVAQTCGSCGNTAPTAATVATTVTQTLQASSVDPTKIIAYPSALPTPTTCPGVPAGATASCSNNNNVTVCNNVALTPSSTGYPQVCGVSVTFQYPYQFWLPFTSLNNQQLILTANVQMQEEY